MARVFLSYSRQDSAKAKTLAGALERCGHEIWWDSQMHGGSRFASEIEAALKRSDAVVVLWSASSLQSAWVQDEAAEGRDTGRLVPVVIDGSQPPLGFRQFQAIDLSQWSGRHGAPPIKALDASIAAKAKQASPPEPPLAPSKALHPRALRRPTRMAVAAAAALLSLLVLAAGVYFFWLSPGRADAQSLRVRLGDFSTLSPEIPGAVPAVLREELLAALGTDAIIIASAGEAGKSKQSAAYSVNASVRKIADSLRFTIHLTDEQSGDALWTQTFNRPLGAMEMAPRQVAVAASQVLRCGLSGKAHHRGSLPDETLSLFLSFCQEYWADTVGNISDPMRGLDIARRIVASSPGFARGWSGRAVMANWAARKASPAAAADLRSEAEAAANSALAIDPLNSQAYEVLASLKPRNSAAREALHIKAVSVRPGDCGCEHVGYGGFLAGVGRLAEAVKAFERAQDMVPLSSSVNATLAESQFAAGREADARAIVKTALDVWPTDRQLHETVVRSALWTGRYDEALQSLDDPRTHFTDAERSAYSAVFGALKSRSAGATALAAAQLLHLATDAEVDRPLVIAGLAALGAHRDALRIAAQTMGASGSPAQFVLFEPPLAQARQLPEFAALANRIGLVRYWRESGRLPDFCRQADAPPLCRARR